MKFFIPNFITCLNLAVGVLGVHHVMSGFTERAIYFVIAAAFFDFLDGLMARVMNTISEMGKQLDSLADIVSFGILPAIFMLEWISHPLMRFISVGIAVFSALRLAKFNIDEEQKKHFLGLPTPANAIMICSLVFLPFVVSDLFKVIVVIVSCSIMVIRVPILSFKITSLSWQGNEARWILLLLGLILLFVLGIHALAFMIPLYLVVSLITLLINRKILLEN